jgi:hypothetical protein
MSGNCFWKTCEKQVKVSSRGHSHMQGTPCQPTSSTSQHPSRNNLLIILSLSFSELKMAGAAGSNYFAFSQPSHH